MRIAPRIRTHDLVVDINIFQSRHACYYVSLIAPWAWPKGDVQTEFGVV